MRIVCTRFVSIRLTIARGQSQETKITYIRKNHFLQKNGNRLYKLGEFHLEVPARVLGTIKEWNTRSDRNTPKYDGRLIQVLLLLCMEIENVTENDIIEFVQGSF